MVSGYPSGDNHEDECKVEVETNTDEYRIRSGRRFHSCTSAARAPESGMARSCRYQAHGLVRLHVCIHARVHSKDMRRSFPRDDRIFHARHASIPRVSLPASTSDIAMSHHVASPRRRLR